MLNLLGEFILVAPGAVPALPPSNAKTNSLINSLANTGPNQATNTISSASGTPNTPFAAELLTHYAASGLERTGQSLSNSPVHTTTEGLPQSIPVLARPNAESRHGELLPQGVATPENSVPNGSDLPLQPIVRTVLQPLLESAQPAESDIAPTIPSSAPGPDRGVLINQAPLTAYAHQAAPVSVSTEHGPPVTAIPVEANSVQSDNHGAKLKTMAPKALASQQVNAQQVLVADPSGTLPMATQGDRPVLSTASNPLRQPSNIPSLELTRTPLAPAPVLPAAQAAVMPKRQSTLTTATDPVAAQPKSPMARLVAQRATDSAVDFRASIPDQQRLIGAPPTPMTGAAPAQEESISTLNKGPKGFISGYNLLRPGEALAWSSNAVPQSANNPNGDAATTMTHGLLERIVDPKLAAQQFAPSASTMGEWGDKNVTSTSARKEAAAPAGSTASLSSLNFSSPAPQTSMNAKSIEFMQMDLRDSRGALAEQLSRLIEQRMGTPGVIRIALQPAELGQMELTFSGQQEQMAIVMSAHNNQTRDLLEAHVEKIRTLLSEFGVDQAKIEVASDWVGQNSDQNKATNTRDNNPQARPGTDGKNPISTQDAIPTAQSSSHQGVIDAYA